MGTLPSVPFRPRAAERSRRTAAAPVWCEGCGGDRLAEVREGRRWLGVGRVAMVPIGRSERRMRCTACASDLPLELLDVPTTAALARHLALVTRALAVAVTAAGDPSDPDLRAHALRQVRSVAPEVDERRFDHEVRASDPLAAPALVRPLAPILSATGREVIVADAARVALAAHTIGARQRWLLTAVGEELGLTSEQVCRIVSAVAAEVDPPTSAG